MRAERERHEARMREFEASHAREVAERLAPLEARREAAAARLQEQAARLLALRREHREELRRIDLEAVRNFTPGTGSSRF